MKSFKKILITCFCVAFTLVFTLSTLNNRSLALANCNGSAVYPLPQYGGGGGSPFTDLATPGQELGAIRIRSASRVDAIQIGFRPVNNRGIISFNPMRGGNGGTQFEFYLEADEFINRVDGRSASEIDQLQFTTNKGRIYGPYGGYGGNAFSVSNICLNGVAGRSAKRLDAFQAFSGQ